MPEKPPGHPECEPLGAKDPQSEQVDVHSEPKVIQSVPKGSKSELQEISSSKNNTLNNKKLTGIQ